MIMRSKQLDLIDDDDARRLWINYNRRGWRQASRWMASLKSKSRSSSGAVLKC
jgi:hypothetical protein